jgi:hypothetical protein
VDEEQMENAKAKINVFRIKKMESEMGVDQNDDEDGQGDMSMSERGRKGAEARWGQGGQEKTSSSKRDRSSSKNKSSKNIGGGSRGSGDEEYRRGDENRETGFVGLTRRAPTQSGMSFSERGRMGAEARQKGGRGRSVSPEWEDEDQDQEVFDMTPSERGRMDGDMHWEKIREDNPDLLEQLQEDDDDDEGGVEGGEINKREAGRKGAEARWGQSKGRGKDKGSKRGRRSQNEEEGEDQDDEDSQGGGMSMSKRGKMGAEARKGQGRGGAGNKKSRVGQKKGGSQEKSNSR